MAASSREIVVDACVLRPLTLSPAPVMLDMSRSHFFSSRIFSRLLAEAVTLFESGPRESVFKELLISSKVSSIFVEMLPRFSLATWDTSDSTLVKSRWISEGRVAMTVVPWAVLAPIIALSSLVIGLSFAADGLSGRLGVDRLSKGA